MARIFNNSPYPVVPAGRYGEGVVLPGQHIEVDDPSVFGADQPGAIWVTDNEASAEVDADKKAAKAAKTNSEPADDEPAGKD